MGRHFCPILLDRTPYCHLIHNRDIVEMLWGIYQNESVVGMTHSGLILAGGRGSRMGEIGRQSVKTGLIVNGQPLLFRLLTHMKEAGVTRCVISTNAFHYDQVRILADLYVHQLSELTGNPTVALKVLGLQQNLW